jgi:hypothetical protein
MVSLIPHPEKSPRTAAPCTVGRYTGEVVYIYAFDVAYENISARFHLGDWHRTIDEKLKTLDNLYQLLQHDQTHRWLLMLEATIVLLFVVDLILLFMGLKG